MIDRTHHAIFKAMLVCLLALAVTGAAAKPKSVFDERRGKEIFRIFATLEEGLMGEKDKALNAAKAVIAFEPLERKLYDSGAPNSYARLVRGYNKGWLCCWPAELKLFKGKLRTAVLLGDFYFEVEDFERCESVRRNIVKEAYGKLNKEQTASALYQLAAVCHMLKKTEETLKILQTIIKKYPNCFSSAEALIGFANILGGEGSKVGDEKKLRQAAELYAIAAKVAKDPIREKALFYEADTWAYIGEIDLAKKTYKRLIARYPKGRYMLSAKKELEKLENKENENK